MGNGVRLYLPEVGSESRFTSLRRCFWLVMTSGFSFGLVGWLRSVFDVWTRKRGRMRQSRPSHDKPQPRHATSTARRRADPILTAKPREVK